MYLIRSTAITSVGPLLFDDVTRKSSTVMERIMYPHLEVWVRRQGSACEVMNPFFVTYDCSPAKYVWPVDLDPYRLSWGQP